MPWKETCAVNEREKFIQQCEGNENFAELCRQYGISRKTGYQWVRRYEALGPAGLLDRQPIAQHHPQAREAEVVDEVVRLRKEHPHWGPKKLLGYLLGKHPEGDWPAASTIGDWLNKYGLIRPRRRRLRSPGGSGALVERGPEPNAEWCADFKGSFVLGDGKRCYPLTVTDEYSRYLLLCEGLLITKDKLVQEQFARVFCEYGLPQRIRTDNGVPFASVGPGGLTALSVWWLKLGIQLDRIELAQPQQNGVHERMHRTLKAEALNPPAADLVTQQRVFDLFRREYNQVRPHEALEQTPPAVHYAVSRRSYPRGLESPSYQDMKVRWVSPGGVISWRGHAVNVGACLGGEPVGLRQISESSWEVMYGPVRLGRLDDRDKEGTLHRD